MRVIQVQVRVVAVPAQDAQRGEVTHLGIVGEVSQADLAGSAFAVGRHEQQIVQVPGRTLGAVGRGSLLENQLPQDAAQGDHGQTLRLELDEEDAPRLVGNQWAKLPDVPDLGRGFGIEPQILGLVVEGQIFERVIVDGPVEFLLQVLDQLREAPDLSQLIPMVRGHLVASFSSTFMSKTK